MSFTRDDGNARYDVAHKDVACNDAARVAGMRRPTRRGHRRSFGCARVHAPATAPRAREVLFSTPASASQTAHRAAVEDSPAAKHQADSAKAAKKFLRNRGASVRSVRRGRATVRHLIVSTGSRLRWEWPGPTRSAPRYCPRGRPCSLRRPSESTGGHGYPRCKPAANPSRGLRQSAIGHRVALEDGCAV